MTVNIADLQHDLAPLAELLADLNDQIKALTAEADVIKAKIREVTADAGPDTYGTGAHVVTVAVNRRFNEARALDLIPEALFGLVTYSDVRPDKKKLEALAPEIFEAAFDVYEPRVTVKEAK